MTFVFNDRQSSFTIENMWANSKPVKHVTETNYASHDILIISAMSFFDAIETQALEAGYRPEQLLPMTVDHLQKDLIS